ncbi:hypothetical protein ABK040_003647 [Willaertia magna]
MQKHKFLFATNSAGNMGFSETSVNTSTLKKEAENINFKTNKWNEWEFPLQYCRKVDQLVCGSTFTAFHNGSDIYLFGKYKSDGKYKINNYWNKLDWSNTLQNDEKNLKIKNLFANFNDLIIQLENDLIIFNNEKTKSSQFTEIGIKFITCGPLSHHFIVVDKNDKIFLFQKKDTIPQHYPLIKDITTNEIDNTTIKAIGCSGRSNIVVTINNKIYVKGDNQFHVQAGLKSENAFLYLETYFESEIVDVKCGYFHTIILLKNGTVYSAGYNCIGQTDVYNRQDVTKLAHPLFEDEIIKRIFCTSRGTALIANNNFAYFIGEVVCDLKGYDVNNSMDKNIKSYFVNRNVIQRLNAHKNKLFLFVKMVVKYKKQK